MGKSENAFRRTTTSLRRTLIKNGTRDSEKLAGKNAIITGGDSGIEKAVALLFAKEGADVAIVYLDEHDAAGETKQLSEAEGRSFI